MSIRGVKNLKELVIRYSDRDGSSKGIRSWMSAHLLNFANANQEVQIKTELVRNKHPFIRGNYHNTNSKTICIKNLEVPEVNTKILFLRNQLGRRVSEVVLLSL